MIIKLQTFLPSILMAKVYPPSPHLQSFPSDSKQERFVNQTLGSKLDSCRPVDNRNTCVHKRHYRPRKNQEEASKKGLLILNVTVQDTFALIL